LELELKEEIPMNGSLSSLSGRAKERLVRQMQDCNDAGMKMRYLIVITLAEGSTPTQTAQRLKVARSTVYRVAARFEEFGEAGLVDRREENGDHKLDEDYLGLLHEVVASSPQDYGWPRPTWTREMLVITLRKLTGISIHVSTMSKALAAIGARRGRPKPTVGCPWAPQAKTRRLNQIRRLVEDLPEDEVAVYADEVDIHLNPKIGLDWMVTGQQKEVATPGKNDKRYLAGALDAHTGLLTWVEWEQKNTVLFIRLLWELIRTYSWARKIHVIVDNYCIHSTEQVDLPLTSTYLRWGGTRDGGPDLRCA
jgi:putative transposase